MLNRPTYIAELLAGADHLYKDDISELEVVKATISGPDGAMKEANVPAIFRKAPTHAEHAESIEAAWWARRPAVLSTCKPPLI